MAQRISRRNLLKSLGAAGAAIALPAGAVSSAAPAKRRALRVAHLTDSHCQPGMNAMEGVRMALRHVSALDEPPGLVLTGGDTLHLGMSRTQAQMQEMTDLWRAAFTEELKIPVRHCIGNHDIWGWNREASRTTGNEPNWGKRWAIDMFELERSYYAFSQSGWRFVVLDSVQPFEASYQGGVDDAQLEWLRGELAAHRQTPTVVLTHIPVVQGCVINSDASPVAAGGMQIGRISLIQNHWHVTQAFSENPQVKLCLTGHIHFVDRTEIAGVAHHCSGAVSGTWWRDPQADRERRATVQGPAAPPRLLRATAGYGLVDLYDDGTFDTRYVLYGWRAAPGAGT
jgi:predicted MPP superfamily phosphohydrolase